MLAEVKISIREESGISRMIVLLVKLNQVAILQIRDILGLTPRVKLVLRLVKQVLIDLVHELVLRVAHSALHLVVYYTLVL